MSGRRKMRKSTEEVSRARADDDEEEDELQAEDLAATSANTNWLYHRGVWLSYAVFVAVFLWAFRVILGMRWPLAWTMVNTLHAAFTFVGFHWNKGLPFQELSGLQQGEVRTYTAWEQLRHSKTAAAAGSRKFLTLVPIVLYMATVYVCRGHENETFLLFNTICSAVVVVAKADRMLGVRVFGINQ